MNPGDVVKVARLLTTWKFWVGGMVNFLGRTGEVIEVHQSEGGWVRVEFPERTYDFPLSCLEVVRPCLPGHGPCNTHLDKELPP